MSDLVRWLYTELHFPYGARTVHRNGLVPDLAFTLEPGDVVTVSADEIGELTNPVVRGRQAMTWQIPSPLVPDTGAA